jgi:hypothetical protein
VATPWIVLCEGEGDEAFFSTLIKERGIQNVEVMLRPVPDPGGKPIPKGNTGFGQWLVALKPLTGIDKHAGILVASDNDGDPAKSFKSIKNQIKAAKGYGIPDSPRQVVPGQNNLPRVAVLMLPWDDVHGCLETLCLHSALSRRRKIAKCITEYLACIGVTDWSKSNLAKLKMRCLLSSVCKRNPNTALQYAWTAEKGRPTDLIPLKHKCFDRIAGFLAALPVA